MPKYEIIENHIERRTYIKGEFKGKFIGYFNPEKSDIKHENFYDLEVISGEVKTIKSKDNVRHWANGEPEEFENIEKFLTQLPENLPIEIIEDDGEIKTYSVNLNDKKLIDYQLSNQVYESNKIYGDISGTISGYLRHFDIELESVEVDYQDKKTKNLHLKGIPEKIKTYKQTGNTEVTDNYKRWEYYYSDKSTYWGPWKKQLRNSSSYSFWTALGLIIQIIITAVVIIPLLIFGWKFILPIGILIGLVYLLSFLGNVILSLFKWFLRIAGIVILILWIFGIILFFSNSLISPILKKIVEVDDIGEVSEKRSSIVFGDSIISHHRIWQDYSNQRYEANLEIRLSDYINASHLRNELTIPYSSNLQYNKIVSTIYNYDLDKLDLVYSMLDSLLIQKKMNRIQFAEVIVSLIQDIPYTLILSDKCDADIYNDKFIREYLESNGECQGYTKYGLLTPVEFVSTLKGDCDTRTLLLFTIFSHYDYDVIMLSSELYRHSLIGINLPYSGSSKTINGKKYVVWETTQKGIPPGVISREISDMRFWNVSLISKKNLSI